MKTPKHTVSDVLDVLAEHLDDIIQARLDGDLRGLDWTVILVELDRSKGVPPRSYSRTDVQAQLRMLTEKLGGLGFPFDDRLRTVSTLGGELRIVRNSFAHGDEFEWIDAWRAADYAVRLLDHLDDQEGATSCTMLRDAVLPHLAAELGYELGKSAALPNEVYIPRLESSDAEEADEDARDAAPQALPSAVFEREPTHEPAPVIIGAQREAFVPWQVVIAGPPSVIEDLPKKDAKLRVRAVAAEIVDFEGPIEIERLTRLAAAAFEWKRLSPKRVRQISHQVRQLEGVELDEHGFVWPPGLDRHTWAEFRPQDSSSPRAFEQVSPREIANAIRFFRRREPGATDDAIKRSVLAAFGRTRLTKGAERHLAVAWDLA